MKKLVVILAALTMILTSVAYAAETPAMATVPSKTSNDVTKIVDKSGIIVKVDPKVEHVAELEKVIAFAAAKPDAPIVEYFGEEVKEQIAAVLPDVEIEALEMNEFITIAVVPGQEAIADTEVEFEFTTVYAETQTVIALVGILTDGRTEWVTLEATVLASGRVSVHFTKDVLEKMNKAAAVTLTILSVPAES